MCQPGLSATRISESCRAGYPPDLFRIFTDVTLVPELLTYH